MAATSIEGVNARARNQYRFAKFVTWANQVTFGR